MTKTLITNEIKTEEEGIVFDVEVDGKTHAIQVTYK